jgi:hypothetical protein
MENNRIRYTVEKVLSNTFYQMPKFLFAGEFAKLSNDARVLYSLLKDRHELSVKNGWYNDKQEVYLIMTRDEMCAMLNISLPTLNKSLKELKTKELIDEDRRGQGKPNLLYLLEVKKLSHRESPQTQKNLKSKPKESLGQNLKEFSPINTDDSKTDFNDTKPSNSFRSSIYQAQEKNESAQQEPAADEPIDMIDNTDTEKIQETISANTALPELISEQPDKEPQITELYNAVCDVLTAADTDKIRIAKRQLPAATVKQEFLKLGKDHFKYVVDCLEKNGKNINKNAKSYILTSLYNSLHSIEFYKPHTQTAFAAKNTDISKSRNQDYNIDNFLRK